MLLETILTAVAVLMLVVAACCVLGVLLLPVYLWVLRRDWANAKCQAEQLAEAETLLAEISDEAHPSPAH